MAQCEQPSVFVETLQAGGIVLLAEGIVVLAIIASFAVIAGLLSGRV